MAKEEIKITEINVTKIDPTKPYVVQFEVGDMPREHVLSVINWVKEKLVSVGFSEDKLVIFPVRDSNNKLEFKEVKE